MATRWVITLEARAVDEGRAAEELRGLLKVALRRFGMRCVSVRGDGDREVVRRDGAKGREEEQRQADNSSVSVYSSGRHGG